MTGPKKPLTLSVRLNAEDHATLLALCALIEKRVMHNVALSEVIRKAIREMYATEQDAAE